MTTLNGQPQKITAHQLWCNVINDLIATILWPKRIQNGKSAFMTSRSECQRLAQTVIDEITNFENTRLRVVVDEMIKNLKAAQDECDRLELWHKNTNPIRLWKCYNLKMQHRQAIAVREAFQVAVLILTNTPPPQPAADNVEPIMRANK